MESLRARMGLTNQQERDEAALLGKVQRIHDNLVKVRRKAETENWINDQYYNNNHLKYSLTAKRLVTATDTSSDAVTINKIAQIARGVTAYLNKEHPFIQILPGSEQDAAYVRAKKEQHYCQFLYDDQKLNWKNKQVTLDAYKYKVGWWKVIPDAQALSPTTPFKDRNGVTQTKLPGKVAIDYCNWWDLYYDNVNAQDVSSIRYFDHVMVRPLGELRNNKLYKNTNKLTGDGKLAASVIREGQIRGASTGTGAQNVDAGDDMATILVHETYMREFVNGSPRIRVVTWTTGAIHYDRIWPLDEMPFVPYFADITGSLLDGGGPIRNLRGINRALNQLMSQVQQNARLMAHTNWLIPRNANVNVIEDTSGQFIEYDVTPGGVPQQSNTAGLPAYVSEQISLLDKYMEDIGGSHDASFGRSPGSHASGTLVNQLQEGDNNNLAMMRDNLDDSMIRLFSLAMKTFKVTGKADIRLRTQQPNALGIHDFLSLKPSEISEDDEVLVRTGTNMPYSMQAKQELVMNMWKEKLIQDPQQVLKLLEFTDIETITGTDVKDIERQYEENRQLVETGTCPDPIIAENHAVHIEVIDQLIKDPMFRTFDTQVQDAILDHRSKHIDFSVKLAKIKADMDFEPIKRSLAINFRPNNMNEVTPIERTNALEAVGVPSDAAQIQARGGVFVQDPASAEQQAMHEDNQMMEMIPVQISLGDNHAVHLETHMQLVESGGFALMPEEMQKLIKGHVQAHLEALKSQNPMPGLQPDANSALPTQPAPGYPVHQAALNPADPTPRPLMPAEPLQHKEAIKQRRATENMLVKQAQQKEREQKMAKASKAKTASKSGHA